MHVIQNQLMQCFLLGLAANMISATLLGLFSFDYKANFCTGSFATIYYKVFFIFCINCIHLTIVCIKRKSRNSLFKCSSLSSFGNCSMMLILSSRLTRFALKIFISLLKGFCFKIVLKLFWRLW